MRRVQYSVDPTGAVHWLLPFCNPAWKRHKSTLDEVGLRIQNRFDKFRPRQASKSPTGQPRVELSRVETTKLWVRGLVHCHEVSYWLSGYLLEVYGCPWWKNIWLVLLEVLPVLGLDPCSVVTTLVSAVNFSSGIVILGGTGSGVWLVVWWMWFSTLVSDLYEELPGLLGFVNFVTFSCFLYFALLFLNQTLG